MFSPKRLPGKQWERGLTTKSRLFWSTGMPNNGQHILDVYGVSWDISSKADLTEALSGFLEFVHAAAEEEQGMMVIIC